MRLKDSIRCIMRVFAWPLPSRIAYKDIATRFHLVAEGSPNNVIMIRVSDAFRRCPRGYHLVPPNNVVTIRVSDELTLQDRPHLSQQRGDQQERRFQFLVYCIPSSMSEPWLGDIREMREAMRLEGYSERAITWATASQFALLLIHWGIYRALDVLMPFKKPK
jgi:hypothetical protein